MDNAAQIQWKAAYELGVETIDLQHKYFFNLIIRFAEEINGDHFYQRRLIQELNAYAKFHFISEENMMYKAGYPLLPEHKTHHIALINALNAKQAAFLFGDLQADEIVVFLTDWFVKHTTGEDKMFAEFLFKNLERPLICRSLLGARATVLCSE